jgi:hypothetical protein
MKALIYGPSGTGKTEWISQAPRPLILACETGNGAGLQTLADKKIDFLIPSSYTDVEQFCSGHFAKGYDTLVLDGMSFLTSTVIKDYSLTVPRKGGESKKRLMGVPEIDDYGTMAELERRLLAKLLSLDKHVLVTALIDYYQPATEDRKEDLGGPALPGQMKMGSTAMFDIVMRLWPEPALRDPKDPKSRYNRRVFLTDGDGKYLAKSRLKKGKTNLFPTLLEFNLETGVGGFDWCLNQALKGYSEQQEKVAAVAQ